MNSAQNAFRMLTRKEMVDLCLFAHQCSLTGLDAGIESGFEFLRSLFSYDHAIGALVETNNDDAPVILELFNDSYPQEWMDIYFEKSFHRVDPVVKSHFAYFQPQIWSHTYRRLPFVDREFLSIANDFGLEDGVCHGIRESLAPQGSIFSFSGVDTREAERTLSIIRMITPHLHVALQGHYARRRKQRILDDAPQSRQLSGREKEVLNWLKVGKTNWEISMILNISERTAKYHVYNIQQKLNAATRGYAVAKAIQLELISL